MNFEPAIRFHAPSKVPEKLATALGLYDMIVHEAKGQSFKVLDNESIGQFGPGSIIQFNESFIGCPDCIKYLKIELSIRKFELSGPEPLRHKDGSLVRFVGWTNVFEWNGMPQDVRAKHERCGRAGKCLCEA